MVETVGVIKDARPEYTLPSWCYGALSDERVLDKKFTYTNPEIKLKKEKKNGKK